MLGVWIFYAWLLLQGFRRQARPLLHIQQTYGERGAVATIVNLGREPVHIVAVMLVVETAAGRLTKWVSRETRIAGSEDPVADDALKEAPLSAGGYLVLGPFERMLQMVRQGQHVPAEADEGRREALEIRVIALHGDYESPIAAVRRFHAWRSRSAFEVLPDGLLTRRMTSGSQRRKVSRWLEQEFSRGRFAETCL